MSEQYIEILKGKLEELKGLIAEDSTLENVTKELKCIMNVPGYSAYREWLFQYDGDLLVILSDLGNGHYEYSGCMHEMVDNLFEEN